MKIDHLNDKTTYKMVEMNCDAKVMKVVAKIIVKCNKQQEITGNITIFIT